MLTAYDQIADRWLDSNFSSVDGIAQHKRALSFLASTGPGLALNVGCGCSTRFNEHLRARGLDIEGIDCSPRMIELARTSDPNVRLLQADVCSWLPPYPYDFISAWDSIWHVPLARQHQVLLKHMSALKPGGVFVFSAGGTDQPDEHTDSRMGPEVYYGSLGVPGILQAIRDGEVGPIDWRPSLLGARASRPQAGQRPALPGAINQLSPPPATGTAYAGTSNSTNT